MLRIDNTPPFQLKTKVPVPPPTYESTVEAITEQIVEKVQIQVHEYAGESRLGCTERCFETEVLTPLVAVKLAVEEIEEGVPLIVEGWARNDSVEFEARLTSLRWRGKRVELAYEVST